jgi:oligoribonuclease (3'-5' exoribonuclease)
VDLPTPCNLLIIDTETTGLDPAVDRVVELATAKLTQLIVLNAIQI